MTLEALTMLRGKAATVCQFLTPPKEAAVFHLIGDINPATTFELGIARNQLGFGPTNLATLYLTTSWS